MQRRRIIVGVAALAIAGAAGTVVRAQQGHGGGGGGGAQQHATVQFAMVQPQPADAGVPGSPGNVSTHFLNPDDVTIVKGGTVTFIVNGGGHGIAIHEVSKKTTRADIAEDLCDGNNHETGHGNEAADRIARASATGGNCNAAAGTANQNFVITDEKGNVIIEPGVNAGAGTAQTNPRLDDPDSSPRLLATSGASPDDALSPAVIATNRAGAFLTGTTATAPGNRIQVQFTRTGRFLVICMNRAHAINDHMFGFVNVVGGNDDK